MASPFRPPTTIGPAPIEVATEPTSVSAPPGGLPAQPEATPEPTGQPEPPATPEPEAQPETTAPPEAELDATPEPSLQPPAPEPRRRHVRKGGRKKLDPFPPTWIGGGLIVGARAIGLSIDGARFVLPWLAVGVEIEDIVRWWDDGQVDNIFRLTPKLTAIVLPRRHFTPFLRTGFGGEFWTHGLGSYGRWVAGGGFMVRFRSRFMIGLGLDVVGRVPEKRWRQHFGCAISDTVCSLGLEPEISFGVGF
jgi:hypothetical protein